MVVLPTVDQAFPHQSLTRKKCPHTLAHRPNLLVSFSQGSLMSIGSPCVELAKIYPVSNLHLVRRDEPAEHRHTLEASCPDRTNGLTELGYNLRDCHLKHILTHSTWRRDGILMPILLEAGFAERTSFFRKSVDKGSNPCYSRSWL